MFQLALPEIFKETILVLTWISLTLSASLFDKNFLDKTDEELLSIPKPSQVEIIPFPKPLEIFKPGFIYYGDVSEKISLAFVYLGNGFWANNGVSYHWELLEKKETTFVRVFSKTPATNLREVPNRGYGFEKIIKKLKERQESGALPKTQLEWQKILNQNPKN